MAVHRIESERFLPAGFERLVDVLPSGSREYYFIRDAAYKKNAAIDIVKVVKPGNTKGVIYVQPEQAKSYIENHFNFNPATVAPPESQLDAIEKKLDILLAQLGVVYE